MNIQNKRTDFMNDIRSKKRLRIIESHRKKNQPNITNLNSISKSIPPEHLDYINNVRNNTIEEEINLNEITDLILSDDM